MVRSDRPVAADTASIPPQPSDRASAADHRLRARSSRSATIAEYFSRIHSTTFASGMAADIVENAWAVKTEFGNLFLSAPLGIRFDDASSARLTLKSSRPAQEKGGALKLVITMLALAWNLLVICPAAFLTIAAGVEVNRRTHAIGGGMEIVREGYWFTIQARGGSSVQLVLTLIIAFLLVTMPLLGAFISHAKRRGLAEGYILVTFFGPIGLIVALCLPTNRKGD